MLEKASMRLRSFCTSAMVAPTIMVAIERAIINGTQMLLWLPSIMMKNLRMAAKPATFGPTDRKAATGVGEPW